MKDIKDESWLHDLVEIYNELGGQAAYSDVYQLARRRRQGRGASWTDQSHATIRRTVEDHAESSSNFKGNPVFYSVNGHGAGVWALLPEYIAVVPTSVDAPAYLEGIEGIVQEHRYLLRSRDARLVETRRVLDNYTCQTCGFRLEVSEGKFIIEVHHLNPIGELSEATVTSVDNLICLCPTCHRVAHSQSGSPLTPQEIRRIISA